MTDLFDMSKWMDDVLKAIAPVTPTDILYHGHSVYEARWSQSSIPESELKKLHQMQHIDIAGEPFQPADSPAWTAIRFVWHRR